MVVSNPRIIKNILITFIFNWTEDWVLLFSYFVNVNTIFLIRAFVNNDSTQGNFLEVIFNTDFTLSVAFASTWISVSLASVY